MALNETARKLISSAPFAQWLRQVRIDTDKVFVTYGYSGTTYGRIISSSGGVINEGPERVIWENDYVEWPIVQPLSPTQIIMAANDDDTDVEVRTMDISGTVITPNTPEVLESTLGTELRLAMAGLDKGACFYLGNFAGPVTKGRIARFTVSSGICTVTHTEDLGPSEETHRVFSTCQVDTNRIMITYWYDGPDNFLYVQVIDISTGIVKGVPVQIDTNAKVSVGAGSSPIYGLKLIDTDKVVLLWPELDAPSDQNSISAIVLNLTGTTVSSQGPKLKISIPGGFNRWAQHLAIVNNSTFLAAYTNAGNSTPVRVETFNVAGSTITSNGDGNNLATVSTSGYPGAQNCFVTFVDNDKFIATISQTSTFNIYSSIIGGIVSPGLSYSTGGIPGSILS